MVLKTKEGYICEDCKLAYEERLWAGKCEKWCRAHHSCNLAITRHALK